MSGSNNPIGDFLHIPSHTRIRNRKQSVGGLTVLKGDRSIVPPRQKRIRCSPVVHWQGRVLGPEGTASNRGEESDSESKGECGCMSQQDYSWRGAGARSTRTIEPTVTKEFGQPVFRQSRSCGHVVLASKEVISTLSKTSIVRRTALESRYFYTNLLQGSELSTSPSSVPRCFQRRVERIHSTTWNRRCNRGIIQVVYPENTHDLAY